MMEPLRPTTWPTLLAALQDDDWNPRLRRFRSPYVFRGQGSAAPLTTSLQHLSNRPQEVERHLVRAFRKYALPWHPFPRSRTCGRGWPWGSITACPPDCFTGRTRRSWSSTSLLATGGTTTRTASSGCSTRRPARRGSRPHCLNC